MKTAFIRILGVMVGLNATGHFARADGGATDSVEQTIQEGLAFLLAGQQPDGGWLLRERSDPAVTSLVVKCFIQDEHFGPKHDAVKSALEHVLRFVQPDGGIYVPDAGLRNYYTSVALLALSAAGDSRFDPIIRDAQGFLKKGQWDEEEDHDHESVWFGGAGYGTNKRPDLSNTQLMLEALKQSGLPADDPVYRKAIRFISRCQMSSSVNDQPFARGADDGGFIYSPVNGGESKAGTEIVEGRPMLRSYGSMTYAGFKSLLYAGLDRKDSRVQAAMEWIRRHYTLDVNPNMPGARSKEGLYYYYHVFARALHAWGEDVIEDSRGRKHVWRADLCEKLAELQRRDGSWVNEADRWYEGNPYLVTAYAILALQTTRER